MLSPEKLPVTLPENLPWGELLAGALSGGMMTKAVDWIGKRGQAKAYTMGAVDHAVQTAMGLVTARLEVVEAQNQECEKNLREVKDDFAASRRDREELKAEIDRLMAGPPATYDATAMKRVDGQ